MGKIDTSGWKEFHMTDIGFKVYHGSRITKAERVEGDTVFLTAGFENCGVVGTIGNENIDVWEKPITVDMFGNVFYHDEACAGDDNIYAFLNSKLSKAAKLFVASAVASVTQSKYSYQQQFRQGDANKLSVYLPCTHDGAPDWTYMESYMESLETKVADSLTLLQAAKDAEKKKVNTREWGEFRVGELFIQERGKEKAPKQNELGDCPLIQETNNNNGFDRMVVPTKIIKGNSITVSINYAQNVFYQADDFCASVNIAVLRNNHLNRYNSQFVCSVLRNAHQKFDYTSKISKELLNKETIMLPVDKTGQPDWAYMEEYMRKVKERVKVTMEKYEMTVNEVAL